MIVLLSAASAHAKGSLLSLLADDVVPQISRPSWPATVWITSRSRTTAFCGDPERCSVVPNRRILPVPRHVPLRAGIASWAPAATDEQHCCDCHQALHLVLLFRLCRGLSPQRF